MVMSWFQSSNWGTIVLLAFIIVSIIAFLFTTTLGGLSLVIVLATIVLVTLYYAGVRIDRRLRHGPRRSNRRGQRLESQTRVDVDELPENEWDE